MNPIQTLLAAIVSAALLIGLLLLIFGLFRPCGWSQCPECKWWQHEDGLYSQDEPETWDGCKCEKVCTSCESLAKHKNSESPTIDDAGSKQFEALR